MVNDNPPLACPYQLSTRLTIEQSGHYEHYTIIKLFAGGDDVQFSNSCTVLIRPRHKTAEDGTQQDFVLKIIDPRFAETLRADYQCNIWTQEQDDAYHSLGQEEKDEFTIWLSQNATLAERENTLLKAYREYDQLPMMPSHVDVYAFAVQNNRGEAFFEQELIPQLPSIAYKEVFLRHLCLLQLSLEASIAQTANAHFSKRMPTSYGLWNVHLGWLTDVDHDNHHADFGVAGLLMEYITGTPVPFLASRAASVDDLSDLLRDMAIFQLQVLRCDLQIVDINMHNFLVQYDSNDKATVRMVDFGALMVINPDPCNPVRIQVASAKKLWTEQLAADQYLVTFDIDVERQSLYGVIRHLNTPAVDLDGMIENLLTGVTHIDIGTYLDRCLWRIILLDLLQCSQASSLSTSETSFLFVFLKAKTIMHEQYRSLGSESNWAERSVSLLCSEFGYDASLGESRIKDILILIRDPRFLEDFSGNYSDAMALYLLRTLWAPRCHQKRQSSVGNSTFFIHSKQTQSIFFYQPKIQSSPTLVIQEHSDPIISARSTSYTLTGKTI